MDIRPMTPDGEWLAMGGTGTPHYVVNPDHIKRLMLEGYQIVADPRLPVVEEMLNKEPGNPDEDDIDADEESDKKEEPETKPRRGAKK